MWSTLFRELWPIGHSLALAKREVRFVVPDHGFDVHENVRGLEGSFGGRR